MVVLSSVAYLLSSWRQVGHEGPPGFLSINGLEGNAVRTAVRDHMEAAEIQ